ncbi:MAG: YeeE/YedE thiosulfate transporter family protein [Desulfovibrionaceae bacterium]
MHPSTPFASGGSRAWSPYLAGALTGLLMVLSVVVAGKYFGASTSFARSAAIIEQAVAPEHLQQTEYLVKMAAKDTGVVTPDWQMLFVLGIALGAFLAARASHTFRVEATPPLWAARFGSGAGRRAVAAFAGGAIALFGVRMAGGCPSGHGLSGLMQMSLSGFVALACFFLGGIVTARILYGGR